MAGSGQAAEVKAHQLEYSRPGFHEAEAANGKEEKGEGNWGGAVQLFNPS
jgi:hypothetical protein